MTKAEKAAAQQADDDLHAVMKTPNGRRFVWRLMTQAGVLAASYAADPTATAFNEGRRSIGLNLMREIQRVCPDLYVASLREDLQAKEEAKAPPVPDETAGQ